MALGTQFVQFALSNSRILLKIYKLPHYDLVERHQPKAFCPYCSTFCWRFPNPNANTRWLIYCECNIDLREWCLLSSGPLNFVNLFNFVKQKNCIMIALKWLLIRKSLFIHNYLALNEWIKYVFRIKHPFHKFLIDISYYPLFSSKIVEMLAKIHKIKGIHLSKNTKSFCNFFKVFTCSKLVITSWNVIIFRTFGAL